MAFSRVRANVPAPAFGTHLSRALELLSVARSYAGELSRNPWDFAIEIQEFRLLGVTANDLRWLVCKGLVAHAGEVAGRGDEGRQFEPGAMLTFTERTCFIITDRGSEWAERLDACAVPSLPPPGALATARPQEADGSRVVEPGRPSWDRDRQQLWFTGLLVKQFKLPSPNQETVLATFEEDGWPARIDDPLPRRHELDPKRRLHDTINALNRSQKHRLLRFMGDGSGQGVLWAPMAPRSVTWPSAASA